MSGTEPKQKRPKLTQNEQEDRSSDQVAVEKLLQELEKLQKTLRNILAEARENAKRSIENFLEDKVRKMGAMIGHYFTTFQTLNVLSRKDMEEAVKKMYNFESIRDAEESLYQAEEEWNSFLEEVDAKISPSSDPEEDKELVVGSYGPCKLKLTDISTESISTTRGRQFKESASFCYGAYVLCISEWSKKLVFLRNVPTKTKIFCAVYDYAGEVDLGKDGARKWLQDTKCEFRMFVDQERQLYNALGLKRSVAKVWSISALVYYAEQKRAGRRLVAMFEEDDPTQMGGDFVLDNHGKLALVHRSKVSTDRPPVEELLGCVRGLNEGKGKQ